ncbi:hypothetical protein CKAH01_19108 [Colletotrichum kahawae]|uniref:Uncharacterized protein n=1 Tax=Colletotrichum kahawae TaxID=34407 RepID=A0AAD9XY02_COLKA|nr:hypothetical protein CKAH01_19108 [Colletotrichum kahawae]
MTIPETKTKTLAMASQANSKLVRKTTKQLDEMLQVEIAYRFTPNMDDTSSEEESNNEEETQQLVRYQIINTNHNNQQQHFYSALANQRDRDYTPKLHTEDHPTLRSNH